MTQDFFARPSPVHPAAAFLVGSCVPLFLGGLLSDWAYSSTAEVQWTNFASWLIAGALVFAGFALLWAAIDTIRAPRGNRTSTIIYALLLAVTFLLGFINALVHAKDAWAKMPTALWLSVIVTLMAAVAAWLAFSGRQRGARP